MNMRSYKIESYVPEENFFCGKDARFWSAAFENCFVVDVADKYRILSSIRKEEWIGASLLDTFSLSMADAASLLHLFELEDEFLLFPTNKGTLLAYPAWRRLGLALVFYVKESIENVEKSLKNAQRYAFSSVLTTGGENEKNTSEALENRLGILQFYIERLFGKDRQSNVMAHILMIANLVGCRVHEMSLSRVNITLDEQELERLCAYLFCTFMTMRRYNGKVSASEENEKGENTAKSTHVVQKYGLQIQQSVRERIAKSTTFDLPTEADIASFATHPAFKDYKIEESDGTFRIHLPLRQKALLSSITASGTQSELIFTLFPLL
jgi:hypothetical protein